jgi:uncharacterized protein
VVELELLDVRIEEVSKAPFMELRALDGSRRVLPISIGMAEAAAITYGMKKKETPRPLTHDLLVGLVNALGATLDQLVITEFRDKIYLAELHLSVGVERRILSCRPSDGVAVAIRCGSPIFVTDEVLDECGIEEEADEGETPEGDELVDEFRKFIDDINPEDFR